MSRHKPLSKALAGTASWADSGSLLAGHRVGCPGLPISVHGDMTGHGQEGERRGQVRIVQSEARGHTVPVESRHGVPNALFRRLRHKPRAENGLVSGRRTARGQHPRAVHRHCNAARDRSG
ncbi:hypothetical protein SSAG_00773 [Streptomyces sp. Mg1]|nr:hypothetical protein SSAG_00773 [Streptomyces sp. Mg1]